MELVAEKYKISEVGLIPSDWEVKELGEICFPSKSRINPITSNVNYKCIELEHLSQGSGILLGYTNSKDLLSQKSVFEKGDVLFGKLRPYLRKFLLAEFDGVCTTEIWVLKTQNETANNFLYQLVQSEKIVEAANLSTGTKMPRAEWKTVSETKIPVPTFTEQTLIATALSDADALISSLEKLIAKKRNIKQGAMQKLLQPKEGWEVKKLGEVFTFYSTANYSKAEMTYDGEIGCMHYGLVHAIPNMTYSLENGVKFYVQGDKTKYELIKDGDIIMVDASEDLLGINKSVEVFGVGNKKFISGLHTYLMRDENSVLLNNFRGRILNSSIVKNQLVKLAVGMKVFGVSKAQLKEVLIPFPPHKEQTRIATILSDMDTEITALEIKLEKYKKVKLGMMQNLLTGKIRLV